MKKLNIIFCSFPDYSGNAKVLYEYMREKYSDRQNLYWAVQSSEVAQDLCKKGIDAKVIGTEEFYERIKTIDLFFTTHANLTDYKAQNSKKLYIELWHGVSPKCIGYLINDISENDKLWIEKITKKIDYFIVPSKFWLPIFAARFNISTKKVLPLGFPLFDSILKSNGTKNLEKVLGINLSSYKRIIYYMPTVRAGVSRDENISINQDNIFNIKKYSEQKLLQYLEKKNYLLCVKYHPSEKLKFNIINSEHIKYIEESRLREYNLDTNMILNAADILITDYSSVGLHYLMLERPVIYICNDLEEFNDNRGILFGNFEFWTENETASDLESLINRIEKNLSDSSPEKIKRKKELLFGNLNDGGCKDICNYLFDKEGNITDYISYTYSLEEELKDKNRKLKVENSQLRVEKDELKREIIQITSSKGYKIIEKVRTIISKIKKK